MVLYKRNDNYKTGKAIKTTSLISSKKEVCVVFSSKKNSRVFFLLQVRNLRDIDRLYSAIFYLFYLCFGTILQFFIFTFLFACHGHRSSSYSLHEPNKLHHDLFIFPTYFSRIFTYTSESLHHSSNNQRQANDLAASSLPCPFRSNQHEMTLH